jgi:hypothetical protein
MIADGDGDQANGLYALKLTGLTTRDLTIDSAYGEGEPSGGPYRYVSGSTITNSISGNPFLQDGIWHECTGWTAAGHTPSSGSGTNAVLTLANDVQLTWNWQQVSNESNTLPYAETFESYDDGFQLPGVNGWMAGRLADARVTGDSTLTSSLNDFHEPCGFPVSTNHTKVLDATGIATNQFDVAGNQVVWVDYMARPIQGDLPSATSLPADCQVAYGFNSDGHPAIWSYDLAGRSNQWVIANQVTVSSGDWVRLSLKIDYQTQDAINHKRYFQIRINGNLLSHPAAWTSNDGLGVSDGSWFAMPSEPDAFSQVVFGTAIDDLAVTTNNPLARNVEIFSAHGQATPAPGIHTYTYGDTISLSVTNETITQEGSQFVLAGWTADGHTSASGTTSDVIVTLLTNNLTLTWLWSTNYWLDVEAGANGTVSPADQWVAQGSSIDVSATPDAYYHFTGWTGDTQGDAGASVMTLPMDTPRTVHASFTENLAAQGTPEWWLASHGLTDGTFAEAELEDSDSDGMPAWEEWISDTNPTNSASVLKISTLEMDGAAIKVHWVGGVQATQILERCTNLISGANWTPLFTNVPPTLTATHFIDSGATNSFGFYRIRARR